jgi:nucleoside-diphosphate-sugar epimerase
MKVLLTGGSGFLGGHLAEALVADGHRVRALIRASSPTAHLSSLGVELVRGDVGDLESLPGAVSGIDAVIHAAGLIRARRRRDLYAVNAEGTRALAAAAAAAGFAHFVYVSSLAAGGPAPSPDPVPADHASAPLSHYGRSKRDGERAALDFGARMAVRVLRPPILYGPRDREMLALFRMARRGRVPIPRLGDHRVSLLYAPDAARAALACLAAPAGSIHSVNHGEAHTWPEVVVALGAAVGSRARAVRVPLSVLAAAAACSTAFAWLLGRASAMPWDGVRDLRASYWVADNASLGYAAGWAPSTSLAEGLARTARWYAEVGWL